MPRGEADAAAIPVVEEVPPPTAHTPGTPPLTFTLDVVHRFAEAHRTLRAEGVRTADLAPTLDETDLPDHVRTAIQATGLTVDEFLVINSSLIPAYFVARLREAGLPANERPAGVRESHISFVEKHRQEIEELLDLGMD